MIKFLIFAGSLFISCRTTVDLNRKYHIDTKKPVIDYSMEKTTRKMRKANPLMLYFDLLDSTQKKLFLDSLKTRIDSIEYRRLHIQI